MVIVSDYMEKVNSTSGQTFVILELSGGLELVQSQNTGKFYATSRKCRIPSTFNADVAKLMVGQQIDGLILIQGFKVIDFDEQGYLPRV